MASNNKIRYFKCPFCDKKYERPALVRHVGNKHTDMIPEGFSPLRYVFHYVNKKPLEYHGRCTECKGDTPWDENVGRYKRQCGSKACHDSFVKKFEENMVKKTGHKRVTETQEGLEEMLKRRKISGKYKFQNGKEKEYVGSYERNCLEFMDKVMNIDPDDIMSPGPTMEYVLEGKRHYYITDFYYQPYNLIIEVKDGGDNPNTRNMPEYRKKQMAKEKFIIENTDYNYLRLTDNDLSQLLAVMADLKMQLVDGSNDRVVHVNEYVIETNKTSDEYNDMIKRTNLIFDIGDVLVNYKEAEGLKDFTDLSDEIKENVVRGLHKFWADNKKENVTYEEEIKMAEEYIPNEYKIYTKKIYDYLHTLTKPFDYTEPMLIELKRLGYKLYYLSNWSKGGWYKMIELGVFDFLKYFDGGIASWETGIKKPNLNIYRMLLNKYNLDPNTCIFYDDKKENVDAAEKLGIYGVEWKEDSYKKTIEYARMIDQPEINIDSINETVNVKSIETFEFSYRNNIEREYIEKLNNDFDFLLLVKGELYRRFLKDYPQFIKNLSDDLNLPESVLKSDLYIKYKKIYLSYKKEENYFVALVHIDSKKKLSNEDQENNMPLNITYSLTFNFDNSRINVFDKLNGTGFVWYDIIVNESITEAAVKNFIRYDLNDPKASKYFKNLKINKDDYVGEVLVDSKSKEEIGHVLIGNKKDKGFITDLGVESNYRKQGFGTMLLKDAINNYGGIDLSVEKSNTVALNMYKNNGFVIIKEYEEKGKTMYWMKLKSKLSKDDKVINESKVDTSKISYSEEFKDVKNIVDTLTKEELSHICNGTFKNSPFIVYRKVCLVNNDPAAFIDVYSIPSQMKKDECVVVCACKKKYRGNGLIKLCANGMVEVLKQKGFKTIYWETTKTNKASSALAKSLGFTKSEDVNPDDDNYVLIIESAINEGYIISTKDILYNKDKFDSGEINICFITGLSGSGKSTLANNLEKNGVEKYELDDVLANYVFSDKNLKEYGDLIYSFFTGKGKQYRMNEKPTKENNWLDDKYDEEFEKRMIRDFVKYSIIYAKSHSKSKYVIEGIELYWFLEPEELKDYAVYIKGTSALLSMIRSAKRDSNDAKGLQKLGSFLKNIFRKDRTHDYIKFESEIQKWRDYFTKLTD